MINMEGKIVRIISNLCTVEVGDKLINCKPRGKFYHQKLTPLVGDKVIIDEENAYILDILPRKNSLHRPTIANVDGAIIVTSVKEPNLSLFLLDKLLTLIISNNIKPIICFTKVDLLNENELKEFNKIYDYYNRIGISAVTNSELGKLEKLTEGMTLVLTGQTGAGKSSLLNRLNPNFNLDTNEISKALGRGVHTTRHTELFKYKTSLIADTPGFSSLDLEGLTKENIRDSFIEFGFDCKFSDCYHKNEQGCSVKERVESKDILESRYDNYLKLVMECESSRIIYKK